MLVCYIYGLNTNVYKVPIYALCYMYTATLELLANRMVLGMNTSFQTQSDTNLLSLNRYINS